MRFRTAFAAIMAVFLMAVPCFSASCAIACSLTSLHTTTFPATDCPMHGMTVSPHPSVLAHGHGCIKLCDQRQALANLYEPAHDLATASAVLPASYLLPPPALTGSETSAKLRFIRRSGNPPPLSSLRV